jgi:hypothetical protein
MEAKEEKSRNIKLACFQTAKPDSQRRPTSQPPRHASPRQPANLGSAAVAHPCDFPIAPLKLL